MLANRRMVREAGADDQQLKQVDRSQQEIDRPRHTGGEQLVAQIVAEALPSGWRPIQYWISVQTANTSGMTTVALAAMFIPGMMPHRLKMKIVKNRVVIIGT